MSRPFRDKSKDLVKLDVLDAASIWVKKNNVYLIRSDVDLYGRVAKGLSNVITKTNRRGYNHQFVDEFSSLPKNSKNKIIDMLANKKNRVVYLVKRKHDK